MQYATQVPTIIQRSTSLDQMLVDGTVFHVAPITWDAGYVR